MAVIRKDTVAKATCQGNTGHLGEGNDEEMLGKIRGLNDSLRTRSRLVLKMTATKSAT
jgi:hypothetical protein